MYESICKEKNLYELLYECIIKCHDSALSKSTSWIYMYISEMEKGNKCLNTEVCEIVLIGRSE